MPRLGVDTSVIALGLDANGALQVPDTAEEVGWWTGGSLPGEVGPGVLAGHVNLDGVPGVFRALHTLVVGDEIQVTGTDGIKRTFVVTRTERHPKDQFPTTAVYSMTEGPELRLITCGGSVDRRTGRYRDNVIVFAALAP